jgi:hypothetical protein
MDLFAQFAYGGAPPAAPPAADAADAARGDPRFRAALAARGKRQRLGEAARGGETAGEVRGQFDRLRATGHGVAEPAATTGLDSGCPACRGRKRAHTCGAMGRDTPTDGRTSLPASPLLDGAAADLLLAEQLAEQQRRQV